MQPLRRLSERYGIELYVKRDDLSGTALSGNKIRKLEFVLADALAQKTDTVITCGGAQSNHCRATAIAAAMLGLNCRLILRTPDPSNPPPLEGNILLDRMTGAEIVWITPDEYQQRDELMSREAASIETSGRKAYTIPEGASNALGALTLLYGIALVVGPFVSGTVGDSSLGFDAVFGGVIACSLLGALAIGAVPTTSR